MSLEQLHQIVAVVALSFGAAWASGINLYAALLAIGLFGYTGTMPLPESLQLLENPLVLGAAGLMFLIEFVIDKIPGLDNAWDTIHTFIRLPAGAVLAVAAVGDVDPAIALAAALVGGSLAAGSHFAKTGSRLLINTSPEPFSNIGVSLFEDFMVIGGLLAAVLFPWFFLIFLALFLLLLIWLMPLLWRTIVQTAQILNRLFRKPCDRNLPKA